MSQDTPPFPRLIHVSELSVRWGDMDALRHVNNATYLVYLQEARLHWVSTIKGGNEALSQANSVVASSEIRYRRPVTWPATLRIELYCERIGNSSAALSYRLLDAKDPDCLYAECRTGMVWVHPTTGKPVPIPDSIRTSLSHPKT